MSDDLFTMKVKRPLADQIRPEKIEEVVGQDHLLSDDAPISRMLKSGNISSFVLWGPPGVGKTTIAKLIAQYSNLYFEQLSAVFSGVADLKKVFQYAIDRKKNIGKATLLFIDEIHRFNKSQQDSFLPYVEDGTVILVGATTENPSFELNAALLSRCQVFTLNAINKDGFEKLLERAEKYYGKNIPLENDAKELLVELADGDGRYFLNMVENIFSLAGEDEILDKDGLIKLVKKRSPLYDKGRDGHYNLISAVHKSLRGSDADAALYWVSRMIDAGEDPKYIFRRLIRFSVEDISLADPNAVVQANNCFQAYLQLGSPEGELALSQLVIYLATAPKSAGVYKAHKEARACAKQTGSLMPPKHILNAPTKLMSDIGYGEGYKYDHDEEDGFSGQDYFPDEMGRRRFYKPVERGFEREIKKRIQYWDNLRNTKNKK